MPFLPVGLETASEAPGWAQTGPCRAFLRSSRPLTPCPWTLISVSHSTISCWRVTVPFNPRKHRGGGVGREQRNIE